MEEYMSFSYRRIAAVLIVPITVFLVPAARISAQSAAPSCTVTPLTTDLAIPTWASSSGWQSAVSSPSVGKTITAVEVTVTSGYDAQADLAFNLVSSIASENKATPLTGPVTLIQTPTTSARTMYMFLSRKSIPSTLTATVKLCVAGPGTTVDPTTVPSPTTVTGGPTTGPIPTTTPDQPSSPGTCTPTPGFTQCDTISFTSATGAAETRTYAVPIFTQSTGQTAAPKALVGFPWKPTASDTCTTEDHNKWWVQGPDGNYYPTWHPVIDPVKGCTYGHDHGDNPQLSPIYRFSGGVPFGYANFVSGRRPEEDHVGHKVIVESNWTALANNGAGPPTQAQRAGFTCNWLSHIHQGTHSGDALHMNEHEYHVNLVCNDGQARNPRPQNRTVFSGKDRDTAISVKLLVAFGQPDSTLVCASEDPFGVMGMGGPVPQDPEARRVLACVGDLVRGGYDPSGADINKFFEQVDAPRPTGEESARNSGFQELWRPGAFITGADGNQIVDMSPYYFVYDPSRVVNNKLSGPTQASTPASERFMLTDREWIRTVEICSLEVNPNAPAPFKAARVKLCDRLKTELGVSSYVAIGALAESPRSPFKGLKRAIHPKGGLVKNTAPGGTEYFCTKSDGASPTPARMVNGLPKCDTPTSIPQRVARTDNQWNYPEQVDWGVPGRTVNGNVQGSDVSTRPGLTPGEGFEWVRLNNNLAGRLTVHAPN
jgi:hypothetical protein